MSPAVAQPPLNQNTYTVVFGMNPDIAHVQADIYSATGSFYMGQGYKDGVRSDHVSNLVIQNGTDTVPFSYNRADSSWRTGLAAAARVHLSYDVDLSYLQTLPDWAALQYGKRYGGDLYLVTADIFIIPDAMDSRSPATVSLSAPDNVKIFAPWASVGAGMYSAPTASLAGNTLVLGDPPTYHFERGGLVVTMAFVGGADRYRSDLVAISQYSLERYETLFGSAPQTPYLLTIVLGDEDGQSFDSSSSIRTPRPLVRENRVLWANDVAHELFHLWNGRTMRPVDPRLKFFVEGFTEYEANRTLLLGKFISPAEYWEMAARHLGSYVYFWYSPNYNIPLIEAGEHTTKNRFGVYDGGWTLALCLDLQMRKASGGKKSLDDIMRAMWSRYDHPGTPYSYDDLVSTVSAVFGSDYGPFFKRYVSGTDLLPFSDELAAIGVRTFSEDFDGFTFIDASPRTTIERVALDQFLRH
jgi:predicted metalloprotease with PDZ domain